jgi:lipid-A-disaccharide synthase
VKELASYYDKISLYGTGGPALAALGQEQIADVNEMSVMGFLPIIKKLPFFLRLGKRLEQELLRVQPDAVLLADYTGFNLRFGKRIRKHGFPAIELVAPQVWIWHYSRVKTMRYAFDKVLTILPFEEDLLRKEGINAVYIGHPLTDGLAPKAANRAEFCRMNGLDPERPIIGIVPGSRPREINVLMPTLMGASALFREKYPEYQYVLGRASTVARATLDEYIKDAPVTVVDGMTPDLMRWADMLWICSGTATLEAAIIGTPMIILYKVNPIDVFIAHRLTSLRMIGMPNIISGKYIMPELTMKNCNPENLALHAEKMRENLDAYRSDLAGISAMFAGRSPLKSAASEIVKTIKSFTN